MALPSSVAWATSIISLSRNEDAVKENLADVLAAIRAETDGLRAKYDALIEAARALHSELMRVQSILMEGDIVRLANNLGEVLPTLPTNKDTEI